MEELKQKIETAIKVAGYEVPTSFDFTIPPSDKMGDYSTSVALAIASKNKVNPKEIAEKIVAGLKSSDITSAEIAGLGFINIKLSDDFFHKYLKSVLQAGTDFGKSQVGKDQKVLVEFISANPTGPLHIGNARGGPIGEVLANVLSWQGYHVEKEFYVNDTGNQIKKFADTLAYYYTVKSDPKFNFPEGGYPGEFLRQVSEEIQIEHKTEISELKDSELSDFFAKVGLEKTIRRIKEDIAALGISFDRFVYESDFLNSGKSIKIVEKLKADGHTNSREGALWFTSNDLDPNDRETVLLRSDADKTPTYFATDIAYHKDKFERGNDRLIDVWGANHHGHIARLKSAMKAIGCDESKLSIILYQNVRLKKDGETKQMGKRLGNFINFADLITKLKVPADVFKYMIISQATSSIIDFDLDVALEQSEKNPVYYLQYAYARICSILRNADAELLVEAEKIANGQGTIKPQDLEKLTDKKEIVLIKTLAGLSDVLEKVSGEFQIQALPHFATEIARAYHNFYSSCQVLSEDKELTRSRLLLVLATRNVLKISLMLMGISAPEKM
ncbi:MAG: arginine--tRNA ligase [Candidatus Berkelbacteria bacterium]|nr:arginine--tRNA ligase [Candidatus Berkelbacteria bacterium]